MDIPCCFCNKIDNPDQRWTVPSLWDNVTGKVAHHICFQEQQDKLNHDLEFNPCCDSMSEVAGYKINADPFTKSFAVYDPNNDMKYYFSGIKFCPFCGKAINELN